MGDYCQRLMRETEKKKGKERLINRKKTQLGEIIFVLHCIVGKYS